MTSNERRGFLRAAAAALAASPWLTPAADTTTAQEAGSDGMANLPPSWTGKEQIGMLL